MISHMFRAHTLRGRRLVLIMIGAVLSLLVLQQLLAIPGGTVIRETLHDSAHVPWFCLVTLLLRLVLVDWYRVAPVALALAIGTEGLQQLTGRDADPLDVLLNLLGALLAFSLDKTRRGQAFNGFARVSVVVLVVIAFSPLGWKLLSLASHYRNFPILLEGSSSLSTALVRAASPMVKKGAEDPGLHLEIDDRPMARSPHHRPGEHLAGIHVHRLRMRG